MDLALPEMSRLTETDPASLGEKRLTLQSGNEKGQGFMYIKGRLRGLRIAVDFCMGR
jgi:hypothetical protein